MLAFECHEEALLVQPTIKPQLDRILEQGAEDADPQRRKVVAETLLKRRLKEMVPLQEGIYPDTSLILCAEYQSFLDEQCAQGQYYQPDHWNKVLFPPGQALLPILGVRPSAAQAFCWWLTAREQGLWQYRLPELGEYQSEEVHIRPAWLPSRTWDNLYCYWQGKGEICQSVSLHVEIASQKQQVQDVALNLDLYAMNNSIVPRVKVTARGQVLNYLDLTFAHASTFADISSRADDFASTFNHFSHSASDLAHALDHVSAPISARYLLLASDLASDLDRIRNNIRAFISISFLASMRALIHNLDSASTHVNNLKSTLTHTGNLDNARALSIALNQDLDSAVAHANKLKNGFNPACILVRDLRYAFSNIRGNTHISKNASDNVRKLDNTANHFVNACNQAMVLTSVLARELISDRARRFGHTFGNNLANSRTCDLILARDLARISTTVFDLDCAESQRSPYFLDLALLLALLSICVCFSVYELSQSIQKKDDVYLLEIQESLEQRSRDPSQA